MKAGVEQAVVERVEDGDKKEKKSRRRSNRRSKQNNSNSEAACSSVNESQGDVGLSLAKRSPSNVKYLGLGTYPSVEQESAKASPVSFNSMPAMHINDEADQEQVRGVANFHSLASNTGGRTSSKSFPDPDSCRGSFETSSSKDSSPYQTLSCDQSKISSSHWSVEVVNEALEKGDLFRALFRVNAHNRLEAYCKIDGVQTDILINGVALQNRAVEGDIVAIKIDPLTSWTRMKGSSGSSDSSATTEDGNVFQEVNEISGNSCKSGQRLEIYSELDYTGNPIVSGNDYGDLTTSEKSGQAKSIGQESNLINGYNPSASYHPERGSSSWQKEPEDAIGKISFLISSHPSKRPTGRVVFIIEKSSRRDTVVGFLNAKQWLAFKEGLGKNVKRNKNSSFFSEHEFIQLVPTDARFPKMMVLAKDLPEGIRKRLNDFDTTMVMELVAARIEDWYEESDFPYARVLHVFGRGCEMQPNIDAILFQNSINCSEFSSESISCLPCLPWNVPPLEFQRRKDLRNKCIFTIDPSTATDLDDALSIDILPTGTYRVGVHIADVSYFVQPDTTLDLEAQSRSTTVYMLRRKISMLPPLLSENLGSLNPGVDRLAFSIFWDISSSGNVIDRWIGRTVIHSCCKLSYEQAQDIIDGIVGLGTANASENGLLELHGDFEWSDVMTSIKNLNDISRILKENRLKDGGLAFENSKISYSLDEDGIPYESILCQWKDSNFLIEEFMLLANRTAAEVIARAFPDTALLRRHPEPNMRKLREFEAFCSKHGLALDTSSSGQFRKSLEQIKETLKDDSMLFDILISYATKPMQVATYFCTGDLKNNEDEWGHYALALPLYTHFTSPLRRYPDIVVHRMLAAAIEAEEMYLKNSAKNQGDVVTRCFTGISFDNEVTDSREGHEALSAAALKYGVPGRELLSDVAAYCNERKLASRHVKDAIDKLYMWVLLKEKQILITEARVLGLGPRFMSLYIPTLAIERRIYYDEVEGLFVEWLETTSTLVLSLFAYKSSVRRGYLNKFRALEDAALVVSSYDQEADLGGSAVGAYDSGATEVKNLDISRLSSQSSEVGPMVFPMTVRLLSTIPVALHAVGGDVGPIDISARLYMSTYLR
ncbi:DIS3-like exonuclease 2 isoform X1 [Eucalyptus grandis]|uniref:DIS3-like exonuclease 2 isoform X1 n=1 Tax=Eucalyptus grandis TaxID=71139 RepID=UPI00192EB346|nr:DIS3-like exonuclease 2 isoform X1 [Eucalyptus grandis]